MTCLSKPRSRADGQSTDSGRFWAQPDLSLIPRIHEITTSDIVGYWPRPIGVVRDSEAYVAVIDAIARVCPDFSLTAPEYARTGDLHFVRCWRKPAATARSSSMDSRVLPDGRVRENRIFCDHPLFAEVA